MSPWRRMCSSVRLVNTATSGRNVGQPSSWYLDTSQTVQSWSPAATWESAGANSTFPASSTRSSDARRRAAASAETVDLPFVPVTPSTGARTSRQPSSSSSITSAPRSRASATIRWSGAMPGLFTSVRAAAQPGGERSRPRNVRTPRDSTVRRARCIARVVAPSQAVTAAGPASSHRASIAARPARPRPATAYGPGGSVGIEVEATLGAACTTHLSWTGRAASRSARRSSRQPSRRCGRARGRRAPPPGPRRSRPRAASPPPVPEAALAAARAAGDRARAAGGGGTAMPGRVLLDMVPDALERLAARLEHGVVLVSGTNGKTTTASMIAAVARRAGHAVVHNRAGANTHWGAATALVEQTGDVAVLEVDEAWLTVVAPQVRPRVMVLLNLFRDRLDAYGERESLVAAWQRVVETAEPDTALVLNADDAFVGALHAGRSAPAVHYGIEDRSLARPERDHAADALHCRVCDGPLSFDAFVLSHLGHCRCSRCGTSRPAPQVAARAVRTGGLEPCAMEVDTPAGPVG